MPNMDICSARCVRSANFCKSRQTYASEASARGFCTAKIGLLAYGEGRLDRIEELEEPILDCNCEDNAGGRPTRAIFWNEIATANIV